MKLTQHAIATQEAIAGRSATMYTPWIFIWGLGLLPVGADCLVDVPNGPCEGRDLGFSDVDQTDRRSVTSGR